MEPDATFVAEPLAFWQGLSVSEWRNTPVYKNSERSFCKCAQNPIFLRKSYEFK